MINKMKDIENTENGVLANLFRKIILDTSIVFSINTLINSYVVRNKKGRVKSSIVGLVLAGSMSWNSFCFLIHKILRIRKMIITIELHHDDKGILVTKHTLPVTPNNSGDIGELITTEIITNKKGNDNDSKQTKSTKTRSESDCK